MHLTSAMDSNKAETENKKYINEDKTSSVAESEDMGLIPRGSVIKQTYEITSPQVPVNKVLEVIVNSLHQKETENKQLREMCAQLEQKLRAMFVAKTSEEKLLELRRQSEKSKEVALKTSVAQKAPGSPAGSPSGKKLTEGQNKLPVTQKSLDLPRKWGTDHKSLSRTKSEPPPRQNPLLQVSRKTSHPEIFLFPEMKPIPKQPSSLDSSSTGTLSRNINSNEVSVDGDKHDMEVSLEDPGEFEGLEDGFQEPPGVSAVYFNNVINELMKTKTFLHNLQQKSQKEGASEMEMEKMRNEIQQLRLTNIELKNELARREKDVEESAAMKDLVRDNSFELQKSDDTGVSEQQQLNEREILHLKTENEELKGNIQILTSDLEKLQYRLENQSIGADLVELREENEVLKRNMKILSICLSEEKIRSKMMDDQLKNKIQECKKLLSQLGSLRQQYEELQQEKNALEKEMKLECSRLSASHNRSFSTAATRCASGYAHGAQMPTTTSSYPPLVTKTSRSDSYNIYQEPWRSGLPQNNLSQIETKQSNLSMPYQCPRCLERFQVETTYQVHLDKCIE